MADIIANSSYDVGMELLDFLFASHDKLDDYHFSHLNCPKLAAYNVFKRLLFHG